MRRIKQAMPEQECIEMLKREPRGVMAIQGEDGYPYAFPLNYIYLDGKLYFHCAKTGHKLDALAADNRVSFCVMDQGYRKEGDWALTIKSIVIFGRIHMIDDPDETVRLVRQLGQKYFPPTESVEEDIRRSGNRVQVLELCIDHMTGKTVHEK
ncbi:pyridoxamine 5'-phosphate oxidase family protein [Coriobacterium glomerans]|nr:pyridoxamine 5'-phosphate oxidase family protein [Coriobacterium glomerans]